MTIRPFASITSASAGTAVSFPPTASTRPPRSTTTPSSIGADAIGSTRPPRITTGLSSANAALCAKAGIRVAVHSDSASGVQRLWHEASKCVRWGMPEAEAIRAITINPAWQAGVDKFTGSIEAGKDADLALFSKHPFDVTTRVDGTWIDGVRVYERREP